MNHCKLTRLETQVRASLWALWRGEQDTPAYEANRLLYIKEVGEEVYAELVRAERAVYNAQQAQTKVVI